MGGLWRFLGEGRFPPWQGLSDFWVHNLPSREHNLPSRETYRIQTWNDILCANI